LKNSYLKSLKILTKTRQKDSSHSFLLLLKLRFHLLNKINYLINQFNITQSHNHQNSKDPSLSIVNKFSDLHFANNAIEEINRLIALLYNGLLLWF